MLIDMSLALWLKIFVALISFSTLLVSYLRNKDVFSPIKIYVIFNGFFYLDVYIGNHDYMVMITYILQCSFIFILAFFEPCRFRNSFTIKKQLNYKAILVVWVLSAVSVINQLLIIQELGSVSNYIGNIAMRVEYFKGRGYVIVLNNLISIMNVVYFALLLTSRNVSKKSWLMFVFHFFLFVTMALLSGSRSFLLMTILVEVLCFHYLYKRLSAIKVAPFVIAIGLIAAVLGGVRNTVSAGDGNISINQENFKLELTHFKYGLIPLDIIYKADSQHLSYGLTYFSLLTNFIPRAIYPEKLDTGGLVFTKLYTGDQWGGLSNLATGAVTEGIINFGFPVGFAVGFLSFCLFLASGLYLYAKLPVILLKKYNFAYFIFYIYIILAMARYSYSEFSYTFYTYIIYYLIPVFLVIFLSRIRIPSLKQ